MKALAKDMHKAISDHNKKHHINHPKGMAALKKAITDNKLVIKTMSGKGRKAKMSVADRKEKQRKYRQENKGKTNEAARKRRAAKKLRSQLPTEFKGRVKGNYR